MDSPVAIRVLILYSKGEIIGVRGGLHPHLGGGGRGGSGSQEGTSKISL
jgi:hypothetical protein